MTEASQRPLSEVVRRWETPFERDPVDLASLSYDPAENCLTLVLVRHSDERALQMKFWGTQHFRVMDEAGWSGELADYDYTGLYDEPISHGRPVTTQIISASALRYSAWPEIVFQMMGAQDWIYVIGTGWDCIEVVATAPPELSWV